MSDEFSPSTSLEVPDALKRDLIIVGDAVGARGISRAAQTAKKQPCWRRRETFVDVQARATQQKMRGDERFVNVGYTPGFPWFGVRVLHSRDASTGVTNPGYRPDDEGITAFPASIVVGSRQPGLTSA